MASRLTWSASAKSDSCDDVADFAASRTRPASTRILVSNRFLTPLPPLQEALDDVSHRIDGRFIACAANNGTKSRSCLDQSSIGQRLNGFTHDCSTNIVSLHDFPFGRQGIAVPEFSGLDHVDEGLKQPVRGARRLPFDPLCDLAFGHRVFVLCLVIPKQTKAHVTSAAWGGNG